MGWFQRQLVEFRRKASQMTTSVTFIFDTIQEQVDFLNKVKVIVPNAVPVPAPPSPIPPVPASGPLFVEPFSYPDGLITNEYTCWNPTDPKAVKNANWGLDSGSLFAKGGQGWSGIPDAGLVDPQSFTHNDSAIFRLVTQRRDFLNVAVSLKLTHNGFVTTGTTPSVAWDGIHVFLRYQSEYSLYYASINRRDNTCVIKKKVPGGPSNNGTYYDLTPYVPHKFPSGTVQNIKATIQTNPDNSVTISLYAEGVLIVSGIDKGANGAVILAAGGTGVRGDNSNFLIDDFTVTAL
jgi:hypothetical protein